MEPKKILPVWQPLGSSTHIIAKKISEKYGVKTSHTGTLDPMAEGVIIVLLDDERLQKYEYAKWQKTYEFEIVFGISTDSYDGLGLVDDFDIQKLFEKDVKKTVESFKGSYTQNVPPFSAIKIKGKPLHWYASQNQLSQIELPQKRGEIYKSELVDFNDENLLFLIDKICSKISLVKGDLRQDKVISNWRNFASTVNPGIRVQTAKIIVEVSKGLYIRSLSNDIAKKLNTYSFVFSLIRAKNGQFARSNSIELKNLFPTGW